MNARVIVRAVVLAAALACGSEVATAQALAEPVPPVSARSWSFRVPGVDKVVFHGSVNHDLTGMGTSMMMYPAPNAVGFIAGVITHGLLNAGMRERQKNQVQADADLVLAPLEPVLIGFTNQRLFEAAVARLSAARASRLLSTTEPAGADWLVEAVPVFSMTQDRRAIVLDTAVRIFAPGTSTAAYLQTVRVVSTPLPPMPAPTTPPADAASAPTDAERIVTVWLESQGQRLVDQSIALFTESVEIALAESAGPRGDDKSPQKTFRYAEGGTERMERAQLVSERCGRRLIRSLRGWLISVPTTEDASASCSTPAALAAPQ